MKDQGPVNLQQVVDLLDNLMKSKNDFFKTVVMGDAMREGFTFGVDLVANGSERSDKRLVRNENIKYKYTSESPKPKESKLQFMSVSNPQKFIELEYRALQRAVESFEAVRLRDMDTSGIELLKKIMQLEGVLYSELNKLPTQEHRKYLDDQLSSANTALETAEENWNKGQRSYDTQLNIMLSKLKRDLCLNAIEYVAPED